MPDTTIQDELYSASGAVSITNNTATFNRTRAVYIGESNSFDFSFDGTNWIEFQGCVAGGVLPIQVLGARYNAGGYVPSAGSIVFLY